MLNIIWPAFIIISYIYAIFVGNINEINNSIFDSCRKCGRVKHYFSRNNVLMVWNYENCSKNDFGYKIN
mgnify:CR=1 FL=1